MPDTSSPPANPLTLAIEAGDQPRVARLCREHPRLAHTFDTKSHGWGDEQWMPLHRAALLGHVGIIGLLLDQESVNPDCLTRFATPDHARATALHWSAWMGHADAASLLLDRGASIDLRDFAGSTPLHYACLNGKPATAALLVDRGADREARDNQGRTPLMLAILGDAKWDAACGGRQNEVAALLIDRGVDVNATNPKIPARFTALHACVDAGVHRLPVAQRLLNARALPGIKDPESNMTPREVAQMFVRLGHEGYQAYVDLFV